MKLERYFKHCLKRPKGKLYIVCLFKQPFVNVIVSLALTATMKVLKTFSNNISLSNTIIQFLANCILGVVFAYWAIEAFQKYSSEPLSTQVFYQLGDTEGGMTFPVLTFCNWQPVQSNPILKQCADEQTTDFAQAVFECLKKDSNSTLSSLIDPLHFKRTDYIGDFYLQYGDYDKLELSDEMWIPSFHRKFGLCYSLDISEVKEFEHVEITESEGLPMLKVYYTKSNDWSYGIVLVHDKYDLADAFEIHPKIWPEPKKYQTYLISIKKRIKKSISTKSHPCSQFPRRTCQGKVFYEKIIENFQCQLNFALDGLHLKSVRNDNAGLPICTRNQALDIYRQVFQNSTLRHQCPKVQACSQISYSLNLMQYDRVDNRSKITMTFQDPIVESTIESISYDLQSLISEVGGVLGLTLGLSGVSLTKLLSFVINKLFRNI